MSMSVDVPHSRFRALVAAAFLALGASGAATPEPVAATDMDPGPEPESTADIDPGPEPKPAADMDPGPGPESTADMDPGPEPESTAGMDPGPEPESTAGVAPAPAPESMAVEDRLRAVIGAVCSADDPAPDALTLPLGGAIELSRGPLRIRDRVMGVRHSLMLPDGARIRLDRIETDGLLRRVVARYAEPTPSGRRPVLLAVAGSACNVMAGRRLTYDADGSARSIELLPGSLERAMRVEPLNPRVPGPPVMSGAEGPRVRVGHVDSGVNYLLPRIASRLARDEAGALVGFDFRDLDTRPFDANPARSAFHLQRHGTRTASLILEEAPVAALVPYRYPRHHMSRMPDLVEHAASAGVRIVNVSMGSRRSSEWADFEAAARARPEMLFVVSAGNDGADIDESPVYPASLPLDNLLVVTSADDFGLPARGANRGRESVDLAVPAEQVLVTGFDGRVREASGSSYAAARVSALAACLLAAHPAWTAPELKSAILARAEKPVSDMLAYVGGGWLRDPTGADRGACDAEPAAVTEILRGEWTRKSPGTPEPGKEADTAGIPLGEWTRKSPGTPEPGKEADTAGIPLGEWTRKSPDTPEPGKGTDATGIPLGERTPGHFRRDGAPPPHTHAIALEVVLLDGSGWRVPEVHRAVGRAAAILGQCGVAVARTRLRMVEAPRRYRYLHDAWSPRLVGLLDPARPAVFFVEETLREPAFEAEAFGQGNTRSMRALRDTVWITRAAGDVGVVLAHELFHVLADLGRHESDPGNLMNERVAAGNTRLHDWQCERLRKVATAFGLAVPVQ